MELRDRLEISDRRLTADGYLVATAKAARTGIQHYLGAEVERPDLSVAAVYRPPEEVFREDSLASYAYKPVTDDHPSEMVNAANWKDHVRGTVGPKIVRDGEYVAVPLMLADAGIISALDDGKRELSAGYSCKIDWSPGVTPTGERYDGIQRNIRINHVALVDSGRAGSECRVGDQSTTSKEPDPAMTTPALQTVLIDGVSLAVDALTAQLVTKQNQMLADAAAKVLAADAALTAGKAEAQKQIDAKDGEIAALKAQHKTELETKDGEITALKSQVLDSAGIERRAAERAELVTTVKALVGDANLGTSGMSDADLRKLAVEKALGDDAKTLTSDAAIEGAFKAIAKGRGPINDPVRDAFMAPAAPGAPYPTPNTAQMADANKALEAMKQRMENAWKPKAA